MDTPVSIDWAGNKNARFSQIQTFLKKADLADHFVWARVCSAPSLGEFLANRVGGKAHQRDSNRLAFFLYITGKLDGILDDTGKALSAEAVLAIMLGRLLSASGTVPPVGNARDGYKQAYSKFHVENQLLIRSLDKLVIDTGGFMRPAIASEHADPSKRVSVARTAEIIKGNDEIIARIEEYARDRTPRAIPVSSNIPTQQLLIGKESAKERKARKQRERRAALKAAKSSK